ncbi:hypothetical protein ACIO8G_37990 [Streptomyces sp. NPDC087219]|uniref:hypothetical protein n=1 Tax=Streptomyces sp. NPDC087219 TaxID=3365770 RepID=UPI00380D65D0
MIIRVPLGRAPTFQRGSALETQLLLVGGYGEHGCGLLLGLRLVQFDAYTTPVVLGNEESLEGRVDGLEHLARPLPRLLVVGEAFAQ